MSHIAGHDRSQTLLLPERLDDYVDPENPVRFIEAFVDGLDLTAAGFIRVSAKRTGRPGYNPADLLKLYIYGYLNRVRSSRRLEAETHRNIEVIWLLRHLKPDWDWDCPGSVALPHFDIGGEFGLAFCDRGRSARAASWRWRG